MWINSELYFPEETSTGHVMTLLAEGLAASRDVGVICSQPTYSSRGTRAPATESRRGVRIFRCSGTRFDKDSFAGRLLNMATITAAIAIAQLRRFRRGDIALAVTNPPILPLVTALTARLKGARVVIIVHDLYPEALVTAGLIERASRMFSALDAVNRWAYRRSLAIVAVGRDMAEIVAAKNSGSRARVIVIPNWADLQEVRPDAAAGRSFLESNGLRGKFVVQYAGNMGRPHGVETLASAAALVRDPSVQVVIIGSGHKRPVVERIVREQGLSNVTLLPPLPRSEQIGFLNGCDVAVIPFVRGMYGLGVPSRMYNIMAAGKPVIAAMDAGSEVARLIEEERIGWVVPPEDPEALAGAIAAAAADRRALTEMGDRARAAAEKRFSLDAVLGSYDRLLTEAGA